MTSIQIDRTDGLSSAVAIKGPCRAATTANITLSGHQTIDAIAVVTDDRILVKDQTTSSENGIWIVDTGPWRRAKDFSRTNDVVAGTEVGIVSGTLNGSWKFFVTTIGEISVGTTSIVFERGGFGSGGGDTFLEALGGAGNAVLGSVATLAALQALTLADGRPVLMCGRKGLYDGAGGVFEGTDANLSPSLLSGALTSPTSIDTATDELVFTAWPGWVTCYPLYVVTGNTDMTAGSIVWVSRAVDNYTRMKLHTTFADAYAGTGAINLTSASLPAFKVHRDPLQAMVVIPTGLAKDGSQGGWRRADTGPVDPDWFGAIAFELDAAPDDIEAQPDFSGEMDSGHEVAMAWHWCRTSYQTGFTASLDAKNKLYKTTISIDWTGLQSPFVKLERLRLAVSGSGVIAFDLTGANTANFLDLVAIGDSATPPAIGFLNTRAKIQSGAFPVPSAGSNSFSGLIAFGKFTQASGINMSADLTMNNASKFYNSYVGKTLKTVAFIHAGTMGAVEWAVGPITSKYRELSAVVDGQAIGTTTVHEYPMLEVRRTPAWSLTPTAINVVSNKAILTFAAGSIAANGITNLDPVFFSASNITCTIPRGNYTLNNISGDTAELWLAGGGSAYDATAGIGTYSTARVTNNTGYSLVHGGYSFGVKMSGYVLGYSAATCAMYLPDGDIYGFEDRMIHENAQCVNWDIIPHATDDRKVNGWRYLPRGNLISECHIRKQSGGKVILDDPYIDDEYDQPGIISFPNARMFGGTISQLEINNCHIKASTPELVSGLDGVGYSTVVTGTIIDRKNKKTYILPRGTYSPTITALANLDAATVASNFRFEAYGEFITVRGRMNVDATAGGVASFEISLPVTKDFGADSELHGFITNGGAGGHAGHIVPSIANDTAAVSFLAVSTTTSQHTVEFTYKWK